MVCYGFVKGVVERDGPRVATIGSLLSDLPSALPTDDIFLPFHGGFMMCYLVKRLEDVGWESCCETTTGSRSRWVLLWVSGWDDITHDILHRRQAAPLARAQVTVAPCASSYSSMNNYRAMSGSPKPQARPVHTPRVCCGKKPVME